MKDLEKRAELEQQEREEARVREDQAILKRKFDEERGVQHSAPFAPVVSAVH